MFDAKRLIAERALAVDASGIRKVFDLAAKVANPINLSIGQPDFDVPESAKAAAIEAIGRGENRYTVTQGLSELNAALRERFDARFAFEGRWGDYGSLVISGVSGGLMLALMATVNAGDEVIVPDPYFVMYKHLTKLVGGVPRFVDTYPDFKLTAERVEPHITERTKALLVSSPSNPTGVVLSERECCELAELCAERGVLLISDEIYDAFCYEPIETPTGAAAPSPASFSDAALVLRGYSKTYGMTGWRLGYAMGPRAIVEQMTKLQQYTFVCAPSMVQHAGVVALEVDMSEQIAAYERKRDRVLDRLGGVFEIARPGGAFYVFPEVPGGLSGSAFVERAIARDVLIIPGQVFSERDTHFRISYACDDAMLDRGLDVLVEIAAASGRGGARSKEAGRA